MQGRFQDHLQKSKDMMRVAIVGNRKSAQDGALALHPGRILTLEGNYE